MNTAGASAAATLSLDTALASRAHAGCDSTIPIALVGCGGRGTGAAVNALSTAGPTKLVAMADLFRDRLEGSLKQLGDQFSSQLEVPPDSQFLGIGAFRSAIDAVAPGGVVLLATPPAFRPIHLEYAVERGVHVFMEKSFAVDAPGIRRVLKAGEAAKARNLKIAGGLMSRHFEPLEHAIDRIHQGDIGEVVTCWAYRMHGPVGFSPRPVAMPELEHQIRNYSCFTWLNGSFILDWLIHNLDVCCWAKGMWPESAQGQGGRSTRTEPDQLFDHEMVEYTFPDGTRLLAQGRHMDQCWGFFGDMIQGTAGCAVLGEGVSNPRLFRGFKPASGNLLWQSGGPALSAYQREHDMFFHAVREDLSYNEADRCASAALTGILGRMAVESGKRVTWEEALASNLELAPGLDQLELESAPPVRPDPQGRYPIAKPGQTVAL
jgi:predicted dehydrogenase